MRASRRLTADNRRLSIEDRREPTAIMMALTHPSKIQPWCKRLLSLSIISIAIASVVTLGSGASTKVVYSVGPDKIVHCLAFGWVVLLAFGAVRNLTLRRGLVSVVCVIGFGVAVELVQYPIPYRAFNPIDIFANTCGVILGSILCLLAQREAS